MSNTMAELIAKRFIQRRDAKAIQLNSGAYMPHLDRQTEARLPWTMADIDSHLAGTQTFGHYLLDAEDQCKLFAFDIDLEQSRIPSPRDPEGWSGSWCQLPDLSEMPDDITEEQYLSLVVVNPVDPREAWRDRAHPARPWLKLQLKSIANILARAIKEEFDLPVAVAYSGSKGLHVYGFTGAIPAHEAREAAELVLQAAGGFQLLRGSNFYNTVDQTPLKGYPNLSIEIFPKQSSLEGKDLGNLMRLPLGKNLKSPDPTFFVDMTTALSVIAPHQDPLDLLTNGNPWK